MTQNLLAPSHLPQTPPPEPNREPVRIILIGSPYGTTSIIHTLYRLGFAEVWEWSPVLPGRTQGEVMRVMTRKTKRPPTHQIPG
ncbi:MAG: peptide ABC transporter substrate-binding protein [Cyanobacteriota bacterium]|nr:peptide ABC transporter substrate-binding protein [Cyanobacteriota bacterium]